MFSGAKVQETEYIDARTFLKNDVNLAMASTINAKVTNTSFFYFKTTNRELTNKKRKIIHTEY